MSMIDRSFPSKAEKSKDSSSKEKSSESSNPVIALEFQPQETIDELKTNLQLKCSISHCTKVCKTNEELNIHMIKHNAPAIQCPICNKEYNKNYFIKKHQEKHKREAKEIESPQKKESERDKESPKCVEDKNIEEKSPIKDQSDPKVVIRICNPYETPFEKEKQLLKSIIRDAFFRVSSYYKVPFNNDSSFLGKKYK